MRGNYHGSTGVIRTLKHSKLSFLNQLSLKALSIIRDSGIMYYLVTEIIIYNSKISCKGNFCEINTAVCSTWSYHQSKEEVNKNMKATLQSNYLLHFGCDITFHAQNVTATCILISLT